MKTNMFLGKECFISVVFFSKHNTIHMVDMVGITWRDAVTIAIESVSRCTQGDSKSVPKVPLRSDEREAGTKK